MVGSVCDGDSNARLGRSGVEGWMIQLRNLSQADCVRSSHPLRSLDGFWARACRSTVSWSTIQHTRDFESSQLMAVSRCCTTMYDDTPPPHKLSCG